MPEYTAPGNPTAAAGDPVETIGDFDTAVLAPEVLEAETPADAAPAAGPRPTIRWGALVWALLFGAVAAVTLWVLIDPSRRDATLEALAALQPAMVLLYGLLVTGGVVALFGLVGLIRRGERQRRERAGAATH